MSLGESTPLWFVLVVVAADSATDVEVVVVLLLECFCYALVVQ